MNSEDKTWWAWDYESSDTNPYTCKVAGLGTCEFDIETGEIHGLKYYEKEDTIPVLIGHTPNVAHNASYDLHIRGRDLYYKNGSPTVPLGPVHDTMLMAKHVDNLLPAYDLKSLAWIFLGEPYLELRELKEWFRAEGHPSGDPEYMDLTLPPVEMVEAYCLKDVEMTAKLAHIFWQELKENYAYEIDRQTIMRTVETEERGIAVDLNFYREYERLGSRRVKYNRKKAAQHMHTERNPMGHALRDHLSELGETRKTESGLTQANDVTLRDWRAKDKAIGSVERVRKDQKNIGTYVRNILAVSVPLSDNVGTFHPNFIQSAAVTRRWIAAGFYGTNGAKAKGNAQNFPPEMREGVIARPGYEFWKFDFASIEPRMFSAFMELLMGESTFAEMYRRDPKFSPYLWVIEQCTGHGKVEKSDELYKCYKSGTLGRLYCSGVKRFAQQLRDDFNLNYSEGDCQDIYNSIDRNCPFIKRFQRYLLRLAESQGYLLDPFGAIYCQPTDKPYRIINHLHQGAAAGVFKYWLNEIAPLMREADDHVTIYLHDEIDAEILKKGSRVKRVKSYCKAIESLDLFGLPLRVEAVKGANWRLCK